MPQYLNILYRHHFQYQLSKFIFEYELRTKIGTKLHDLSISFTLPTNKHFEQMIPSILTQVYHAFKLNNAITPLLPVEFETFLERVAETELSRRMNENHSYYIQGDDMRMLSFVIFIKQILLPFYADIFYMFTNMRYNMETDTYSVGGDPVKIMSEIESQMAVKRLQFINDDSENAPYNHFINMTYVKDSILDVQNRLTLFPKHTIIKPVCYYPSFVTEVLLRNNKTPLQKLIFAVFEDASFDCFLGQLGFSLQFGKQQPGISSDSNNNVNNRSSGSNDQVEDDIDIFAMTNEMRNIIYYLCGASVHAILELSDTLEFDRMNGGKVVKLLKNKLTLLKEDAVEQNLPCTLVTSRSHSHLLYVSESVFDVLYKIELEIFNPILSDMRMFAEVGNKFMEFVEMRLHELEFKFEFTSILINAISDVDTTLKLGTRFPTVLHFCDKLTDKFFDFYLNIVAKQFAKSVMSSLKLNIDPLRSMKFRLGVLANLIK